MGLYPAVASFWVKTLMVSNEKEAVISTIKGSFCDTRLFFNVFTRLEASTTVSFTTNWFGVFIVIRNGAADSREPVAMHPVMMSMIVAPMNLTHLEYCIVLIN